MMTTISPFEGMNLDTLLEHRAQSRRDHPFLVWAPFEGDTRTWTYGEFARDVARIAGGLSSKGIAAGDRVLVHFENCPETLLVRFALARIGAICVATNAMAAGPEIEHYAQSSRAVAAITQKKFADLVSANAKGVRWVAAIEDSGPGDSANSLSALMGDPAPSHPSRHSDVCAIMFTTGTTGKPKGVVWTHANLLWACRHGCRSYGLRPDDISLITLPLFHVVGLCWSFLPVLWAGSTAVLQPKFSATRFWPASLQHRATITSQVLFSSASLQGQTPPEKHFYRQWIVARGDAVSQAHNRIPHFLPSWGMTEMVGPAICGDPNIAAFEGALGRSSLSHEISIRTPDGRPVEPGNTGDLFVRGRRGLSVFLEYDGDAAATRAAFDEDGYFRTGDRVTLLESGWIQFSERSSDVIKVGGEGVSPSEIENVIRTIDGVREVAVVGAPDDVFGQLPVAFVEIGNDPDRDIEDRILQACRASLAKFKVPQRVVTLAELPRVGNGKVARQKLRQLL